MEIAIEIVALVAVVAAGAALARRIGVSAPLLLVVIGVAASYLPFVPQVELSHEVVLVGFLPPLLYSAAIRTSLVDFSQHRRSIGTLSDGLIVFTAAGVELVAYWLLGGPAEADGQELVRTPNTPDGCEECLADGSPWVHLRMCLDCGNVGCCDSSPNRHASKHFAGTEHPVMRSFEPGENWRLCFVDGTLG